MAGSVGLQLRTSSPAAGPGLKSGEGKARAGETRARQVSWALDGASARFWGVVVQRGGAGTAAQGLCMAGLCGRAARVWSGGCGGGEVQGVRLRAKKRGCRGSRRAGLREGIPGRFAGDLGCGSCAEQKRKEEEGRRHVGPGWQSQSGQRRASNAGAVPATDAWA